ncbi:GNAT family N-acetyltransferase [Parasphingopyxis marina]|uniref:GNAT family N-acetyltransferase n=1 Tax=Parasphingopyxis marina TaxID=2761622 RepID=A0A842I2M7_9SPHN|nr:GNAT family N-acetyltransferase [Parasphingopyxis marina]MBC2778999.1 GNAT family N-acetyltransferase [Parasphingopyxis marina]
MYQGDAISLPTETPLAARRSQLGAPTRPIAITQGSTLACYFFDPADLPADILPQWTVLADQAAEPNCFAERWFLEPSLALLAKRGDVRVATLMSPEGLLAGLMPLTVKPRYGRLPVKSVQNWLHHNAFLGVPLIRRGMETEFWKALLPALDTQRWARGLFHVSGLTANGRALRGLEDAAETLDRRCDIVHRTRRAMLQTQHTPQTYWEANVRKKKRKEIDRLVKRLGEIGDAGFTTLHRDADVAPWIDAFLELEARGWKGDAGSAIACDPAIAEFFRTALTAAHGRGILDFHRLDLDGKPIAMLVNFLSAPGGFSFKIAFDEKFARFSPGVLIERYNLRILDRDDIAWVDSCASEDHPMIDGLWSERRDIVRVTVPLGGRRRGMIFRLARFAENRAAKVRQIQKQMKA